MSNTRSSSQHGHGKLIAVIIAAALVVVLALLSAFVWPGWALNKNAGTTQNSAPQTAPTSPSIKATALPDNATELLKAMPDSVLDYARTKADASTTWNSAAPLEEYTLTYSTGKKAADVTLVVAQWSTSDPAKTQYDALAKALTGKTTASGAVKVKGDTTGDYVVKTDSGNAKNATALWRNDTVVFQATGLKDSIQRFYQKFPL